MEESRSASPTLGWRLSVTRLMRPTKDKHQNHEVSRWSKTTTESELSEALRDPPTIKTNTLKKKAKSKPDRASKESSNSTPTDPSYDPLTKSLQPIGKLDLPPIAITGPDEPMTFYDSASDDSSIEADASSPIIQRASSVRVGKPFIVEHNNGSGASVPRLYTAQSTPADDDDVPLPKPLRLPGQKVSALENKIDDSETPLQEPVVDGPEDALRALEGNTFCGDELPTGPAEMTTEPGDTMKETILEWPDTATRIEALDTLPTPLGGFGSVHVPSTKAGTTSSSVTCVSPPSINGLRQNPITETDRKLSRAISAPVRNPSRRVMIRPADLIINRANHDPKIFRESIVSTPYPARHSSAAGVGEVSNQASKNRTPNKLRRAEPISQHQERVEVEKAGKDPNSVGQNEKDAEEQPPKVPLSTKPVSPIPVTSKSDRFPSPSAPEVLVLDLRLARHSDARMTVEVEVSDKTTYDDEQLFTVIRSAYNRKLLGIARRFFNARRLAYASIHRGGEVPITTGLAPHRGALHPGQSHAHISPIACEFDGGDFIRHLCSPCLGHRRKIWLLWLRNNQCPPQSRTRMAQQAQEHSPGVGLGSPVFSFTHSRSHSETSPVENGSGCNPGVTSSNVATSGSPPNASAQYDNPLVTRAPSMTMPRMPFQSNPYRARSFAFSSTSSSTSPYHPHHYVGPTVHSGPPTVYLHHAFSITKIVAIFALILFLAAFSTTLWVLFGVPGRSAGDHSHGNSPPPLPSQPDILGWRHDAQRRVGVGLLLGMLVLGLGTVAEAAWAWASWVLA